MNEKTWHAVDCMTGENKISITLCEDGDVVVRKHQGKALGHPRVFNVGKTYMSAYRKLIYAINELGIDYYDQS